MVCSDYRHVVRINKSRRVTVPEEFMELANLEIGDLIELVSRKIPTESPD